MFWFIFFFRNAASNRRNSISISFSRAGATMKFPLFFTFALLSISAQRAQVRP